MLEKLLGLATIGSTFASVSLLHRFLMRLAIVLALTIISALMAGALLIGLFYGLYSVLTSYGLSPDAALVVVGILILIITASLITFTMYQLRMIKNLQPSPLRSTFPGFSFISELGESFLEGFSKAPHRDKHR